MKSSLGPFFVVVAALAITGAALRPLEPHDGPAARPGGWRTVTADLAWVRANAEWEKCDPARTRMLLDLVVALDPRPPGFWLNGARMIAYDFPAWRINAEAGDGRTNVQHVRAIEAEEARRALEFLEQGRPWQAHSAAFWVERANIELNGLHRPAAAAESFRRASEQPDAPYYAARLCAEMLRRAGREAEALAWLVRLHARLPRDDERAESDVVLGRIRELERVLHVPAADAYVPLTEAGEAGR